MRRLPCSLLLLTILWCLPGAAAAQEGTFSQWLSVPVTYDVGEKDSGLQIWTDLHARRGETSTALIVRPALGWRFSPHVVVHAGYGWFPTFIQTPGSVSHEHRIWQQLILNGSAGSRIKLQSRTRFEQRFSSEGSDVGLRLRQFVRVGWRVAPGSPFQLLAWDELFLGLGEVDWGAPQGYDQNRLFVGPGVDVPALGGRLELGYLFNHLNRNPESFNHVLFTQLVIAL